MENETVETPVQEQAPAKQDAFAEFTGLMDGTIKPTVTENAPAKTEKKAEEPAKTEGKPDLNAPISLEDEPSEEEKAAAGKKTDPSASDNDFDKKYRAKLKEDFGDDEPTNIKTKLSAEPPKPKYNTELAKLADEFLPKGMSQKDFFTFVATDFTKMEPLALLDFKLSQESPELTAEERDVILGDRYKNYTDATKEETILGKHQMLLDHKAALTEYETKKAALINDKFEAPKAPEPDPQVAIQREFWKKEAPNVIKAFDKLTITAKIPMLDDATKFEEVPISYQIPAKDQKIFQDWVSEHGSSAGVKTVEEMVGKLKDAFVARNFDKLMQKQTERTASLINERWAKRLANNQMPTGKNPNPQPGIKEGSIGHFMQAMDN